MVQASKLGLYLYLMVRSLGGYQELNLSVRGKGLTKTFSGVKIQKE
jgi:hypothetical protein